MARSSCLGLLVAGPLLALGCATETGVTWRAAPPDAPAVAPQPLPIGLDTVLRLAEQQNGQIALAREKVQEAYADQDLAHKTAWMPVINVGTLYYRHEGGIQNEDGTITRSSFGGVLGGVDIAGRIDLREAILAGVNAERKVWQQKGELSRITSETLLDAASTYIDLLSARTGEAIARRTLKDEEDALEQARGVAKADPGTRFVVEGFEAESFILRQTITKLRQQGDAAALKLAYLLGIGPGVQLVPVDSKLIPIELVDPNQPTEQLVGQALTSGPGVRELEQLVAAVQSARERAQGPGRFMPTVEMRAIEGLFGAGPGSTLDWSNRFDLGVQARWNLTDLFTASEQKRLADSRITQLHLAYQDVRAKLTMGVQEAQQASLSGREEIKLAEDAMQHASEGYTLSNKRLKSNVPGSSPVEVMGYIRALQAAYLNYVGVVSAYDKAQLRLLVLTGAAGPGHEAGCSH
jgi:outer membrane protein TolC